MGDSLDVELNELIERLGSAQRKIGGGADPEAALTGEDGKVDRFAELKLTMISRLERIRELLQASQRTESATQGGAKEAIECQAKIRKEVLGLSEEMTELERLYQNEAKKRRSKYTPEELERRRQTVAEFQMELQTIRDVQRAGFVKGYQTTTLVTMAESEMFRGGVAAGAGKGNGTQLGGGLGATTGGASYGVSGSRNMEMTDQHRMGLQRLKERDQQIDKEIEEIGYGVDMLKTIATAQNQEVKLQNRMLETLEEKIGDVQDHMESINTRMKTTLEEARSSDKICIDIFCILIMIGLISVLVSLTKRGGP